MPWISWSDLPAAPAAPAAPALVTGHFVARFMVRKMGNSLPKASIFSYGCWTSWGFPYSNIFGCVVNYEMLGFSMEFETTPSKSCLMLCLDCLLLDDQFRSRATHHTLLPGFTRRLDVLNERITDFQSASGRFMSKGPGQLGIHSSDFRWGS